LVEPLVSIGLPVFNGERFLAQAIESLLNQTYRHTELIISDNASTDATPDICKRYAAADARVRYSRLPENVGGVPNANRVFSLATGTYYMWASDDDVWDRSYVEQCVRHLERDPGVVLVCSEMAIIDETGAIQRRVQLPRSADAPRPADRLREFTDIHAIADAGYGVTRAAAVRQTPLFVLHPGHDKILLAELALHGRIVRLPEYLYFRREHARRSVNVYRSLLERYGWVSPACAGKRRFPHWAFLRGYAAAVARARLTLRDKAACGMVLLRWVRNYWRELAQDLRP
jgi:glycosyltransferase involved in cell wall biosynthesis